MKKILEVIHPNTAMRTFAHTVNIEGVDGYHTMHTPSSEIPDAAQAIAAQIWDIPAVNGVSFSRGETRVEVSDAWEDEWDQVSPKILTIINKELFDGEAVCAVRDDATEYAKNRRYGDWD